MLGGPWDFSDTPWPLILGFGDYYYDYMLKPNFMTVGFAAQMHHFILRLGPVRICRLLLEHIPGWPIYDQEWSIVGYWTQFELVFLENISQNFLENNRSLFFRKF